ncbi:MAG: DUF86 domain-containing protein [Opitutaceae bacterium]|nr:DUF86 domain-containing protein [Opitutaceae bacterium]
MGQIFEYKVLFDLLNSAIVARQHIEKLSEEEFRDSALVQDAVAMRLAAMGESISAIGDSTKAHLKGIPFHKIRAVRNVIAHSYEDVNTKIIWDIAKNHLPEVIEELTNFLALNTDFEKITAKVHSGPPLELLAFASQKGSALNVILDRAIRLNIASAQELKATLEAFYATLKNKDGSNPEISR